MTRLEQLSIQLDADISRERFEEALALARANASLPAEWLERTRRVGQSPNRTFVAMLGTALLARATDRRIDPFALRAGTHRTGYSARGLCKSVLVPCAVAARIHLGVTGREPLNNRPFISADRVGTHLSVLNPVRPHLDYLCESLGQIEDLDEKQAVAALAAYLRARLDEGARSSRPLVLDRFTGVPELTEHASRFISSDPENGKRGQALVAACLDLVFGEVRTTRVYDPSRHWPGDVVALADRTIFLAVEVKQRPATDTEIIQFAERCAKMGVRRALAATLDPDQPPLYVDEIRQEAWRRHGVHLSILENASDLMHAALTWTTRSLTDALADLPRFMVSRLREVEVSDKGLAEWAALFRKAD